MTTTITTNNHQSTRSTANASSYTLGSYVVSSGSNRVLAVVVSLLRSNENGVKVTSVTFGGVGLTEGDHSGGISTNRSNYVGIWYLVNPSVSTADIVVTPDNAMAGCIISAVTLYGVHQTYPAGRSQRVKVVGNEFDIDVGLGATGGLCLMAASANANNNPTWTWTGSGELYDVNNGSSDSNEIAGSGVLRHSDEGGATCTCSISTAMMVGVGVEFLPVGLSVTSQTINVAAGSDDAIQNSGGTVSLYNTSANVNNTGDTYFAARFLGLNTPSGAYILSAYLRLSIASTTYDTPFLNIQTEDNDEPATFAATSNNISGRSLSGDSVLWEEINIGDGYQRSPNFYLPLLLPLGRGGWAAGDDVVVVLSNAGAGSAFRFATQDSGANYPQLIVTWIDPSSPQTVTVSALTASATAIDLAVVPGAVSLPMNALSRALSAVALSIVPGARSITVNALTANGTVIDLIVSPGVVSMLMDTHAAALAAQALAVVPGATAVSLPARIAALAAINLIVSSGATTVLLNALSAALSVPDLTLAAVVSILMDTLGAAGSTPQLSVVPGAVALLMDTLTAVGSAEDLAVTPGAVAVALNALTMAGSAVTVSIGEDTVTVVMNTLTAAGSAVDLSVLTGAVSILLQALGAAGSAVNVTVTPGAVTLVFNTLAMMGEVIDLTVMQGILLATLTGALAAQSITVVPGAATVLMAALAHLLSTPSLAVLPGGVAVDMDTIGALLQALSIAVSTAGVDEVISFATLTAGLTAEALIVAPGEMLIAMQPLFASLNLQDLLVFLLLGCALATDSGRYAAIARDWARFGAVASDRTGCAE